MITRRALVAGACACAAAACARGGGANDTGRTHPSADTGRADTGHPDTGDTSGGGPACADTGASVEGWVELPLAAYPELASVGGFAYVGLPDALLQVIVAQVAEDCFIAIWRICSHGACETDWDAEARTAVCPCHASVFAEDGRVLEGPATQPLRSFPVVRRGDSLWLQR